MIKDKKELRTILESFRERGSDGDMTPEEYKAAIAKVGLSQERCATFFGRYTRLGRAWALAERPIPLLVQLCLEYMVENNLKAKDFES
jgi:hypothetical protein